MLGAILVANRGEIACRIIRTARKMGIRTIAVYSEADQDALHTELADEAVHIGPANAAESYLRPDKILEAARSSGADSIHPGYGFLSENPDFAAACRRAKFTFIGLNGGAELKPFNKFIIRASASSKIKSKEKRTEVGTLAVKLSANYVF